MRGSSGLLAREFLKSKWSSNKVSHFPYKKLTGSDTPAPGAGFKRTSTRQKIYYYNYTITIPYLFYYNSTYKKRINIAQIDSILTVRKRHYSNNYL